MLSMCTLSAGQAENYYDSDDLYHAKDGQILDGGRIADTMKFNTDNGLVYDEFITKEDYQNMIRDNEKFRQIEVKIKLNPDFKIAYSENKEAIEELNKSIEIRLLGISKKANLKLNSNSFSYGRDGIVNGVKSHNVSVEKIKYIHSKFNVDRACKNVLKDLQSSNNFSSFSPEKLNKSISITSKQTRGRIGLDMTFSAPKSLSLMRFASNEHKSIIEASHKAALGNVLNHLNQEYAYARVSADGAQALIKGNLETYIFNHEQSRLNDPEFHSHVIISNRIKCEDGKTRSIEPKEIFRDQKAIGKLYRMELNRELNTRGITTEITDKKQYFFEIKGVPQEMIKEASGRRQEIETEWSKRGLEANNKKGKESAALETRNTKKDVDLSVLKNKWEPRMEALKIGIGAPIRSEVMPHNQVITEIEKSSYHFTEKEFLMKYKEIEPNANIDSIKKEFNTRLRSGDIFISEKEGKNFYSTRGTIENELRIKEIVSGGVNSSWNIDKSAYKNVDLSGLTNGQRNAIVDSLNTKNQYHAIEGDAGSGKTYMLDYMRKICDQNNIEIKGMAPTNKAVDGMKNESGIDAYSIHSFLGKLEYESLSAQGRIPEKVEGIKQEWDFSAVQKASKKEIWVVDESSMLDNRIARQVVNASQARGAKVILIGDPKQLQAVGPGNAYTNLIKDKHLGCTRMKEVMRQKDIWHVYGKESLSASDLLGIKREAKLNNSVVKFHKGNATLDEIQKFSPINAKSAPGHMVYVDSRLRQAVDKLASGQSVKSSFDLLKDSTKEIAKKSDRFNEITRDYLKTYNPEKINSIALASTNSDRKNLNYKIHESLKKANVLSDGIKVEVKDQKGKVDKIEISIGERLMSLGKHKESGAENGSLFIVKDISKDGNTLTIIGEDKSLKMVNLREFNSFAHAYAVTVHKAQGMSIDHVYANLDTKQKNFSYRNNLYVNLSRAKESVNIYTDNREKATNVFERLQTNLSSKDFHSIKDSLDSESIHLKKGFSEINIDPKHLEPSFSENTAKIKI